MGKIAIIHLSDCFYPRINGVSVAIKSIAQILENNNFSNIVIAPNYMESNDLEVENFEGIKVLRIPSKSFLFSKEDRFMSLFHIDKICKTLNNYLDGYSKFIFLFHNIMNSFFIGMNIIKKIKTVKKVDIMKICYYHTFWEYYLHYIPLPKFFSLYILEKLEKLALSNMDYIMVANYYVKEKLEKKYNLDGNLLINPLPISRIFYDCNMSNIINFEDKEFLDRNFLLYIGRLGKEKNIYFLIDVFRNFLKLRDDFYLYIIGDGPEKKRIMDYSMDIKEKIIFLGYKSHEEIALFYRASKAVIFTSKTETLGLVVLEAMASGAIVFTLNVPPFNKIINNMFNGVVIDKEEPIYFAQKISNVLSDDDLIKTIKTNAIETAKIYNCENFVNNFSKLIYN